MILDDVIDRKVDALDSHVAQFYDGCRGGRKAGGGSQGPGRAEGWLKKSRTSPINAATCAALVKWYGAEKGNAAKYVRGLRGVRVRRAA